MDVLDLDLELLIISQENPKFSILFKVDSDQEKFYGCFLYTQLYRFLMFSLKISTLGDPLSIGWVSFDTDK